MIFNNLKPMINEDYSLNKYINSMNLIDTETKIQSKNSPVNKLEKIIQKSVLGILRHMGISSRLNDEKHICRLFIHGSTKLRVRLHNSDVDVVLVLPNFISRNQWFNLITQKLQEDHHDVINNVLPIIETFVPVIKFTYDNSQFDMVVSCLPPADIKDELNFTSNNRSSSSGDEPQRPELYISSVDPISVRALSSVHIVRLVEELCQENRAVSVKFFRCIKIWTLRRQIDSYMFGFPSAIAWLIMALYVYCTLSKSMKKPNICDLLMAFFQTFDNWQWPTPVFFNEINCPKIGNESELHCSLEKQVMPIMSIVYPFKNTAFSVRTATLEVIISEIRRAHQILISTDIWTRKWDLLFNQFDIYKEYRHFVLVRLGCAKDSFLKHQGLVGAKLRDYAIQLETLKPVILARIHTLPGETPYQMVGSCKGKLSFLWIIGLVLEDNLQFRAEKTRTTVDITEATVTFFHILNEKSPYTNFQRIIDISYHKGTSLKNLN